MGDFAVSQSFAFNSATCVLRRDVDHWTCTSSDLTAATDYIPFMFAEKFIEYISSRLHINFSGTEDEMLSSRAALKNELSCLLLEQNLTYADGSSFTSKRGALMGLPLSWSLLSILHMFLVDQAMRDGVE
jgi:hypothetical protein